MTARKTFALLDKSEHASEAMSDFSFTYHLRMCNELSSRHGYSPLPALESDSLEWTQNLRASDDH